MNDEKIVNRVNPTDNEDAVTKKYVDEKTKQQNKTKTETIDLFSFLSKYAPKVSSSMHSSKKKQRAGITQATTQTVNYIIPKTIALLRTINQDWSNMQHKK